MGDPLYDICYFSHGAFNILSLSLIFVSLIAICLHVFFFGFILPGTVCVSWAWLTVSFPMLRKFSAQVFNHVRNICSHCLSESSAVSPKGCV